ncbi:MAG: hypothetical protein A2Z11_03515 [Candidatus Woykebacteria bacterium RBG_16_43_9]|uniref:Uncharacterized protein n=1 Tax=Candidatus Woykebacteria bacterium RBG_16_43_9 TaxID=1802596 RepID=A0A1G1WDB4_9BACT|nr:MAG: hypothetical protein A2Z11_03515 [Candidatus Woykebacteria bacterium RBG_16_43_9]
MPEKEKFYKVYNSLPLNLRNEVVIVVDDEPITWKVARLEVDNDTKLGNIIIQKLENLNII